MLYQELTTERLRLRKPRTSDWETISYLRTDPTINQFVFRSPAETQEKALAFLKPIIANIDVGKAYYWAITPKEQDQMIGTICLWNFSKDGSSGELGYDLSLAHQGKGLMGEAVDHVVQFAFEALNLNILEAHTHQDNHPSKRLLERHGFKLTAKKDPEMPHNQIYFRDK